MTGELLVEATELCGIDPWYPSLGWASFEEDAIMPQTKINTTDRPVRILGTQHKSRMIRCMKHVVCTVALKGMHLESNVMIFLQLSDHGPDVQTRHTMSVSSVVSTDLRPVAAL